MITTANHKVVVVAYNEYGIRIGEQHHNATIPDATVDRIRELHEDYGRGYRSIAKELNLCLTAVQKICRYERRAQTPVRWKRIHVQPFRIKVDEFGQLSWSWTSGIPVSDA